MALLGDLLAGLLSVVLFAAIVQRVVRLGRDVPRTVDKLMPDRPEGSRRTFRDDQVGLVIFVVVVGALALVMIAVAAP